MTPEELNEIQVALTAQTDSDGYWMALKVCEEARSQAARITELEAKVKEQAMWYLSLHTQADEAMERAERAEHRITELHHAFADFVCFVQGRIDADASEGTDPDEEDFRAILGRCEALIREFDL